jgi:cold shock CspA family protein
VQRKVTEILTDEGTTKCGRAMAMDLVDQVLFSGLLKNINDNSGVGFIECPETYALFRRDVACLKSQCEEECLEIGDRVEFRIQIKQGRPQACELARLATSCPAVASPPMSPQEASQVISPSSKRSSENQRPHTADRRKGMAYVLAHDGIEDDRIARQELRENSGYKQYRSRTSRMIEHGVPEGGDIAKGWMPSFEADQRTGMAAVLANKSDPHVYPVPVIRQGTFVSWKGS